MKIISTLLALTILCVSTPFAFANSNSTYEVEMLVTKGEDTKEENSKLTFSEKSLKVASKKDVTAVKEFKYDDIKAADYSYSKKPMWKTGAVTALFIGVLALPLFFMKSKSHWLTLRTEKDFAILKLEGDNHRQILAELQTHGVKVETIVETKENKDKSE